MREIVRGAERVDEKQGRRVRLFQHVRQFGRAIGRIDEHHHGPDAGRRELQQNPLGPIRRPDCNVVPFSIPSPDERLSDTVDGRVEAADRIRVCRSPAALAGNEILRKRTFVPSNRGKTNASRSGIFGRGSPQRLADRQSVDPRHVSPSSILRPVESPRRLITRRIVSADWPRRLYYTCTTLRKALMMARYFKFKTPEDARRRSRPGSGASRALRQFDALFTPLTIGTRRCGNRLAIQPMEGCDGTLDGRPDELTFRRLRPLRRRRGEIDLGRGDRHQRRGSRQSAAALAA